VGAILLALENPTVALMQVPVRLKTQRLHWPGLTTAAAPGHCFGPVEAELRERTGLLCFRRR